MKRFRNTLIVTVVTSSLIVTPVLAAPSVDQIKKDKAATEQQLDSANSQLVDVLTDFAVLKTDIANQEVKIQQADEDLQKAKALEEKQYREMLVRIKYMYEKGDGSEVAALLGAESFGEMINQAEYVQSVHTYDRKMLNEYQETKEKVADLKSELETDKADMEVMADVYKEQERELQSTISTMKAQVADFDSQLAEAQRQAEEEARRLAEATRKSQAAADKPSKPSKPSNGGSSNGGGSSSNGGSSNGGGSSSNGGSSNGGGSSSNGGSSNGGGSAQKPSNASKGQQIANEGLKYLGYPYVFGGESLETGIDCSAFTRLMHSLCGVGGVPRDSGSQRNGGKYVGSDASDLDKALPGDIICYSGHVAIYIGGGRIVHASNPIDGVKTSDAKYKTIKGIRRYW